MAADKLTNPFVIGRYIDDYYFCDRTEETDLLKKSIENGRDIALISPRRLGKSGLIDHFFSQKEIKDNYFTIFIDIYATSSIGEFVSMLGHAVFRTIVAGRQSLWQKFVSGLKSLRPAISFDPVSGQPSISIDSETIKEPELTLSEIFGFLENAPKRCIVAIDEFQEVSGYDNKKAEALLRTFVQRCRNTRFIFAGSAESMMNTIFNSPRKPFYQSCITLSLKPIPLDSYTKFAMRLFEDYGKTADGATIVEVYTKMRGITWFVQMMMNELFAITPAGGTLAHEDIAAAERNIIGIQEFSYRELMNRLSPRQRKLASYIARKGTVSAILSSETLQESGFPSAASLQSALKGLRNHGLVTASDAGISLYDIFFSRWLSSQL